MEQMIYEGLESCSLKLRQSSASRGVRSRQLGQQEEADLFGPVKVETIPLLSPGTEVELMLREPWQFPREPLGCAGDLLAVPLGVTGEPAAASSTATKLQLMQQQQLQQQPAQQQRNTDEPEDFCAWEEDFQDLSGWCMANAQPRCDFRAGESPMASKLTGTRNEGSNVLTAAEGATRGLMQTLGKKTTLIGNGGATVGTRRSQTTTCAVEPLLDHAYPLAGHHQPQQQQQQQQLYFNHIGNSNNNNNNDNNSINAKAIVSSKDEVKVGGPGWLNLNELDIVAGANLPNYQQQQQQQQQQSVLMMEVEPKQEQPQDPPDVLQSFEADVSTEFDLFSYLCEDDIPSPNDSISTDSSRVTEATSISRLASSSSAHIAVSPMTCEPLASTEHQSRTRGHVRSSPGSSSGCSSETTTGSSLAPVATRSSSGRQIRPVIKLEEPDSPEPLERRVATRPRRVRTNSSASRSSVSRTSGKGRKRVHESDSEDEVYRETREKNNEASRKSRMNKKAKEVEMARRAVDLEKDNRILKMKVEELEKLVTSMRNALLRSALKREVKTSLF